MLAMDLLAWFRGYGALTVAFLLTALGCVVWRLADGPVGYLRDVSTAVFVALYVPFLAGFAVLLAVPDDGARRVVTFIATVVCSDVGGYAAGVCFGRHPMAPTVSPAKSWEGFAGSTIACVVGGTVSSPCSSTPPGGRARCSGWRSWSPRRSATSASR